MTTRTNPAQSEGARTSAPSQLCVEMVRPRGIEPLAFGFVVRRSIHLS
jgi:hypothetical protein